MPTAKKNPLFARKPGPMGSERDRLKHDFREAVTELLKANSGELARWLKEVAEGSPEFGRAPDPARALDLLTKLAEFAAPKLGRIEHTGEDGGPMHQVTTIQLEFVDAKAPAAYINGNAGSPTVIDAAP